jgi:alpha-mannosidase
MDDRVVSKRLQILSSLTVESSRPIGPWQVRSGDHLGPGRYAYDGEWAEAALPLYCKAGKNFFLRSQIAVPSDLPLKDTYLALNFGQMEGMLSVNGRPWCGLDPAHGRVLAPGAGRWELELEFLSVPGLYSKPWFTTLRGQFEGAQLVVINRQVEGLYYDVRVAAEVAAAINDERRKALLSAAVEQALLAVDLTLPRSRLLEEAAQARKALAEAVESIGLDQEAGRLFLTGHSHIDTAWLWPLRETIRKCGRTFSTALRLMDRYPQFHFSCSQAQLYQYTKDHYPAVYEEIAKRVKEGRWETQGGMWVEADCNVTSGESLIRQILYGMAFFAAEFGTRPKSCWLPDVFGYPASLPEILRGCGLDYFFTCKLHWQGQNPFPLSLFMWRGLDGSEIIAHVPKHPRYYNNQATAAELLACWSNHRQKAEYGEALVPFGHGDGGGGVTEEMMEQVVRFGRYPGMPQVRVGPSDRYFEDLLARSPQLPVWDGELYLETHRGTYTTQGAAKRANRKTELLLREAEILGSMARISGGSVDMHPLEQAWKTVLLLQFHDILPGSSIGLVYKEAQVYYAAAQRTAASVLDQAIGFLAGGKADDKGAGDAVCVFNSLSWPRNDVAIAAVADRNGDLAVELSSGRVLPAQVIQRSAGKATIAFAPEAVPPMGFAGCKVVPAKANPASTLSASERRIESDLYLIELDEQGGVPRLLDKRRDREVVPEGAVANDLQLFQDGPENEDAWNVHPTYDKRRYPFEGPTEIDVLETGPVRAVVRVKRTHRHSTFVQDIVAYAGCPRIDFVTRADWHEKQTVLKAAFPVDVRTTRATYEVQFGAVERPTHRNTSWDASKFEVCGQRWMDLSEGGYGVSLLNDCKYGHDARGNVMRLTLLRGTILPDPDADQGRHEFTYSLLPHEGDWRDGQTVQRAWELNAPLCGVPVAGALPSGKSLIRLEGATAIVEAFKPAEDGKGYILRLYEPHGARGTVNVRLAAKAKQIIECNQIEEEIAPLASKTDQFSLFVRPFQIRAIRVVFD